MVLPGWRNSQKNKVMSVEDFKVYTANFLSITLSFSNLHEAIKLALLLVTLGYTVHRWYHFWLEKKEKK